jgi:hypothetical protein
MRCSNEVPVDFMEDSKTHLQSCWYFIKVMVVALRSGGAADYRKHKA